MNATAPSRPSLILTTADNPLALNLVLEAISLQTHAAFEVIVVDCGSDSQTKAVIETWSARLAFRVEHLWQSADRFQKASALNQAVRTSRGDYLIFLDGDCLPHRQFIADHLLHAEPGLFVQGRRAGIKGRYVRRVSARNFNPVRLFLRRRLYGLHRGLRRPWPSVKLTEGTRLKGCNFAVWREDFFRVNGYDENFVGWGHEDTELAERLSNAGLSCKIVTGQLIVYHLDHARVVRYQTAVNERILERTRQEKRTRCEKGLVDLMNNALSA
jgi:glycosyltransferase involved in cell wall biosynthesis